MNISKEDISKLTVPEIKAELQGRNVQFSSKERKAELLTKLSASLHLPVEPIEILKKKKNPSTSRALKWNTKHPAWILLYNELQAGNIALEMSEMGPQEVYNKYSATLELQMNGMEFGDIFCKRLPVSYTHLTLPTIYSV